MGQAKLNSPQHRLIVALGGRFVREAQLAAGGGQLATRNVHVADGHLTILEEADGLQCVEVVRGETKRAQRMLPSAGARDDDALGQKEPCEVGLEALGQLVRRKGLARVRIVPLGEASVELHAARLVVRRGGVRGVHERERGVASRERRR